MPLIEERLYGYLSGYAGLIALVADRIYPLVAPQDVEKPYCVYMQVSNTRIHSHSGYSGLQRPRMQVSGIAETYPEAKAVADQVTAALEAWPGADNVKAAFFQNETDLYEEETGLFIVSVDFFIWHG
ncbi:MAG: hypothetical protein JL50_02945 [Peptococcaceae bacterium BICA1-7]|nr:MAG: hypothetical protein JL50_02945 [Peptococcaceae bacterium BICA1-7]HBV97778.1 DUF3168 domain-containing protein [Desulfotomaculum sp.]